MSLPTDAASRKRLPIYSGVVCYFPHAIAAVAELSRIGNDQHNPGQPLHWAKEKSSDEMDALMRHVVDQAIDPSHRDPDGVLAAVKKVWRALADLERMHDAGVNIFAAPTQPDGLHAPYNIGAKVIGPDGEERIVVGRVEHHNRPDTLYVQCRACDGTGVHPAPYSCVICAGSGSVQLQFSDAAAGATDSADEVLK